MRVTAAPVARKSAERLSRPALRGCALGNQPGHLWACAAFLPQNYNVGAWRRCFNCDCYKVLRALVGAPVFTHNRSSQTHRST